MFEIICLDFQRNPSDFQKDTAIFPSQEWLNLSFHYETNYRMKRVMPWRLFNNEMNDKNKIEKKKETIITLLNHLKVNEIST